MLRQQRWSLTAHDRVLQVKGSKNEGKYKTHASKTPSLLLRSGLLQTLVFLRSRTEGPTFLDDLACVYGTNTDNLLQHAQTNDLPAYLALSRDIMDIAIWFRRFAQVELTAKED